MLSVLASPQLQATILALKGMPAELRKRIFAATRAKILPEWQDVLRNEAETTLEHRIIAAGGRANVTAESVRLTAATSTRRLSGGASPKEIGHAIEFGAAWHRQEVHATSSRGKSYVYRRIVNKQLRPRRQKGYVFFPAAAKVAPRFAALWVQTTVWTMAEALEGKRA